MSSTLFFAGCFAFALPFLAVAAIPVYNTLRNSRRRHSKNRHTANPAFCTSSAALGTILLFAQVFYCPSMAHVVESRQQTDAVEDDSGDPESVTRQLHRQLRKIRRANLWTA